MSIMAADPQQESPRTRHIRAQIAAVMGESPYRETGRGEYKYFDASGACVSTLSLGEPFNALDDDAVFEACVKRLSRLLSRDYDALYEQLATEVMNDAAPRRAIRAQRAARQGFIARMDSRLLIGAQAFEVRVVKLARSLHDFTGLLEAEDSALVQRVVAARAAGEEVLLCFKGEVQAFFIEDATHPQDGMSGTFAPRGPDSVDAAMGQGGA
jgi:hypothetical protein